MQPLTGLNVLDLTQTIAGPFCTKLLADYGAEVIKIERPGAGDPARRLAPFQGGLPDRERSAWHLYLNTNKRSLTLNLKTDSGIALFEALVRWADVLVENFMPRVMPSLGLDYERLRALNPRLVYVAISNYGQTGPHRDYEGEDLLMYAAGGLLSLMGEHHRPPVKHGLTVGQLNAGAHAAVAAMTAVYFQEATGVGQLIDVSIQEVIASILQGKLAWYSYLGAIHSRQPKDGGATYQLYPCADGYISCVFVPGMGMDWSTFAAFLDAPELLEDRFSEASSRALYAGELDEVYRAKFAQKGRHEWFHEAQAWRMPFGLVQTPDDVANCPHLAARDFWTDVDGPATGPVRQPGALFKSTRPAYAIRRPAPTLGEHNVEVLTGLLGYSLEELVVLRECDII